MPDVGEEYWSLLGQEVPESRRIGGSQTKLVLRRDFFPLYDYYVISGLNLDR